MAATETQGEFVISLDADTLVSSLSGDFGDFVLKLAVQNATKRAAGKVPEVTSADVQQALNEFCEILQSAIDQGKIPTEAQEPVKEFLRFCLSLSAKAR